MIRNRISNAFEELEEKGYFAKMDWYCCQNCGCSAIPEENHEKYVFFHEQDADGLRGDDPGCYLAWAGNGKKIVEILKKHKLLVEWDGTNATRIYISV